MQATKQGYSILIADDHQLIIDGISKILQEEKGIAAVYTAANGQDAVDMLGKYDIDCVLMDLNMPVLSGHDATKIIKQRNPGVKVIVVSMLSDASVIAKLLKVGADAFIIKNMGKDELLRAIDRVMDGEKYISPELRFNLNSPNSKKADKQDHLTPRELEIIKQIGEGLTNQEIAAKLFLSPATVDTHRKNVLAKLELKNTAALIKYAAENNLL